MVKYSDARKGSRVNGTSLAPSNSSSSGCLPQYYYNDGFFTTSFLCKIASQHNLFRVPSKNYLSCPVDEHVYQQL